MNIITMDETYSPLLSRGRKSKNQMKEVQQVASMLNVDQADVGRLVTHI